MSRDGLIPRTIVDKNGKRTTVWVKPEDVASLESPGNVSIVPDWGLSSSLPPQEMDLGGSVGIPMQQNFTLTELQNHFESNCPEKNDIHDSNCDDCFDGDECQFDSHYEHCEDCSTAVRNLSDALKNEKVVLERDGGFQKAYITELDVNGDKYYSFHHHDSNQEPPSDPDSLESLYNDGGNGRIFYNNKRAIINHYWDEPEPDED